MILNKYEYSRIIKNPYLSLKIKETRLNLILARCCEVFIRA